MNTSAEDSSTDATTSGARAEHIGHAFELIAAIAKGDAGSADLGHPEDVVAELREHGIDSLDLLVDVLLRSARQSADKKGAAQPIDIRTFGQRTPKEVTERIRHTPPLVPFVLNGTLYDPEDINRFDGRELHLVAGSSRDEVVAFDDRAVVARFWEQTYVAAMAGTLAGARRRDVASQDGTFADAGPERWTGSWHAWPDCDEGRGAYYYSDSGPEWGDTLYCPPNRGYPQLSRVCRGFLCTGDWNDVISACQGWEIYVIAMYEHKDWGGSSYTGWNQSQLNWLGWNDRASGVACW